MPSSLPILPDKALIIILWCVNRHTDDIHILFLVWDTHAPNNEAARTHAAE